MMIIDRNSTLADVTAAQIEWDATMGPELQRSAAARLRDAITDAVNSVARNQQNNATTLRLANDAAEREVAQWRENHRRYCQAIGALDIQCTVEADGPNSLMIYFSENVALLFNGTAPDQWLSPDAPILKYYAFRAGTTAMDEWNRKYGR